MTDKQTNRWTDFLTGKNVMDKWTNRQTDGQTDGQSDQPTDRLLTDIIFINIPIIINKCLDQ